METKEILQGNKLIAEFIGLAYCEKYRYEGWYQNAEFNHRICDFDGLKYHKDWSSIMPVVEKIESMGYEVLIARISCQINHQLQRENPISVWVCGDISKKLEITYDAIIQFITWYNKQN